MLMKLLSIRLQKSALLEDTSQLTQMIDSLCNTLTLYIFSLGLLENPHYRKIYLFIRMREASFSIFKIGPRGVRALPLAASINVGGHYKWLFLSLSFFLSGLIANSPRRGCRRVLKFCTGS